jgi:hypothetical protein
MSGGWRSWATAAATLVLIAGVAFLVTMHNPVFFLVGLIALVTSLLERTYGAPSRRPAGLGLRPTHERFVDPETGRLVTVWFDAATGERRYVGDDEAKVGPAN